MPGSSRSASRLGALGLVPACGLKLNDGRSRVAPGEAEAGDQGCAKEMTTRRLICDFSA